MGCRCADLEKMRADMATLSEANGVVTRLMHLDAGVESSLNNIASASSKSFYVPQVDFEQKVKAQNDEVSDAIVALSNRIYALQSELSEEIETAEEEDRAAHLSDFISTITSFFGN